MLWLTLHHVLSGLNFASFYFSEYLQYLSIGTLMYNGVPLEQLMCSDHSGFSIITHADS